MNEIQRARILQTIMDLRKKITVCEEQIPYNIAQITEYNRQLTNHQKQLALGVFNEY